MPSRVIRGEILHSRSLARVSRDAANLFVRLLLVVDEFGRMDGRARLIHLDTYGDRDDTTREDVDGWLEELCAEGCVDRYVVGKDPVIRLPNNEKHRAARNRAKESRFQCRCGTLKECSCVAPLQESLGDGEKRNDAERSGLGLGFGSGSGGQGSGVTVATTNDSNDHTNGFALEIGESKPPDPAVAVFHDVWTAFALYGRVLRSEPPAPGQLTRIRSLLKNGRTGDDLVHAVHGYAWKHRRPGKGYDADKYRTPKTIFGAENIDEYLDQWNDSQSAGAHPPFMPESR